MVAVKYKKILANGQIPVGDDIGRMFDSIAEASNHGIDEENVDPTRPFRRVVYCGTIRTFVGAATHQICYLNRDILVTSVEFYAGTVTAQSNVRLTRNGTNINSVLVNAANTKFTISGSHVFAKGNYFSIATVDAGSNINDLSYYLNAWSINVGV